MLDKLKTTPNYEDDLNLIHTGSTIVVDEDEKTKQFDDITREISDNYNDVTSTINREAEENRITRTIDRRMMPLFCIFYFVDYLDRANIGNATYV